MGKVVGLVGWVSIIDLLQASLGQAVGSWGICLA